MCVLLLCLEHIVLPRADCSYHVFYGIELWKPEQFHCTRYNNSTTGNFVLKKYMRRVSFRGGGRGGGGICPPLEISCPPLKIWDGNIL